MRYRLLDVAFLPMLKVKTRDGEPNADGYAALAEIVRRRVPESELAQLIPGPPEDGLKHLMDASGGYVRDLLRMLRELLLRQPASHNDITAVIASQFDQITRIIPTNAYPWLARVRDTKNIATSGPVEKRLADRLIRHDVVLRYQNDAPWFELHPAAAGIPELREEPDSTGSASETT